MKGIVFDDEFLELARARGEGLSAEIREAEEAFTRSGRVFRNIDYPLFPRVIVISAELRRTAQILAECMLEILDKVISLYESDPATHRFFMLRPEAEELAAIEPGYRPRIRISRFDTFLSGNGSGLKILENNTDCPAGVIFTGYVVEIARHAPSISRFLASLPPLREDPIAAPAAFAEALLATYRQFCGDSSAPSRIGVLQIRGAASAETREMTKIFSALGLPSVIADPRDLVYRGGRLLNEGEPLDLVWNKINTVYFENLDVGSMGGLVAACRDRAVCHVNSFQARYITESKLCLAYLSDPRFRPAFTAEEAQLLDRVIPWSRRLESCEVCYQDGSWDLHELARERQADFVLKAAYDIRGDGVTIGRSTPASEWRELLARSWGKPFILQAYVPAPSLLTPKAGEEGLTRKRFSLDLFTFGGRFQGFGSKMSSHEKLNLFQGGSKLPVFSLAESVNGLG